MCLLHTMTPGAPRHSNDKIKAGSKAVGLSQATLFGTRKRIEVFALVGQMRHLNLMEKIKLFFTVLIWWIHRHLRIESIDIYPPGGLIHCCTPDPAIVDEPASVRATPERRANPGTSFQIFFSCSEKGQLLLSTALVPLRPPSTPLMSVSMISLRLDSTHFLPRCSELFSIPTIPNELRSLIHI